MPHVYRKLRTKPIPSGATPKTRRGIAGVQWIDGRGRESWAALHADGKRIVLEDLKYTIQYVDSNGKPRETGSGTRDERAAREIAASIEVKVARQRRGLESDETSALIEHARRPIGEHVRGAPGLLGYADRLRDKDDARQHIRATLGMLERVFRDAGVKTLGELDSAKVARAIRGLKRQDGTPLRNSTFNLYVRACRAFSTWCYKRKRLADDVLRDLETASPEVGRTLFRREITEKELTKIIAQAEADDGRSFSRELGAGKRKGKSKRFTAPGRAWAYRIAAGTGFRAREIGTLKPEAFSLTAKAPTITVEAVYSKRRRLDVQPISPALAAQLRPWLAEKPRGKPLFRGWQRWGEAIKADAEAAGVAVTTARGVLDFHALRHTYASRVAAVSDVVTGRALTRHASVDLYVRTYAKEREASKLKAVASLPAV